MDPTEYVQKEPQPNIDALSDSALYEILERGAPILGPLEDCITQGKLSNWMSTIPDKTQLVHMNLPGTHDTCTWNYTPEVQESLKRYTGSIHDSRVYRCQQHSIFKMLNAGIRVLDLRYAWNPDLQTIGFYHSKALLSPTTTLQDVLFGLYYFLTLHPSETVLVSMNYEPGTGTGTWNNDARLQQTLYTVLTSKLAKRFWKQRRGDLGTLGENRGKLILIQRFDFTLLPPHSNERIGIHLDPRNWTVNGKDIEIEYAEGSKAYIQDYYKIDLSPFPNSNLASYIHDKLNVITDHLRKAIDGNLHPDELFISFASASCRVEEPSLTPQVYALGHGDGHGDEDEDVEGEVKCIKQGINHALLSWLKAHPGERYGIILLDFYDAIPGLIESILGISICDHSHLDSTAIDSRS